MILARVAGEVAAVSKEGVVLEDLDALAEKMIREAGAEPAFLGYLAPGSDKRYPASICASVNEVVVHGLPTKRKLRDGDLLKIDFGVLYKGFYTDTALTVGVGKISPLAEKLIRATREALALAIEECHIGKAIGDISWVIGNYAKKNGFSPAKGLTGHGIGKNLHEDPSVFNEGVKGKGLKLEEGLVIAVEPMFSAGRGETIRLPDDSFATKDGSLSAHFEHTIAITKAGPEVLTE